MKALRIDSTGIAVREVHRPAADGEALVRVIRSGICSTDLEIARGYAGFRGTIGHEFVGVVEIAADKSIVGKRVVGEINAGCGECTLCRAGDPRHCPDRTVLGIVGRDGAHAEFLKLPLSNLHEIDQSISDNQAVFVEPLAAAFAVAEQVELLSGTRVAVIGDGKLGILCARCLSQMSGNLILVGKHKRKLDLASSNGRFETVLLKDAPKLGRSFDVVVEASGSESGFTTALDLLRPRGKLVLKSTFHGSPRWPAARVVVDEITVVGSRCGRFRPAIELLRKREVVVTDLISDVVPLADGVRAMKRAAESGVLKVLLVP